MPSPTPDSTSAAASTSFPANATRLVALAGNPNVGKTTVFNQLTGMRQKVGNYPGVTVERKTGHLSTKSGAVIELVDVPGTYSLNPRSLDEEIAYRVLAGEMDDHRRPGKPGTESLPHQPGDRPGNSHHRRPEHDRQRRA